jgi:hypothetical protein
MENNIRVTFQKHDATISKTENISLDIKLSDFRKVVQLLLSFPSESPFVLVLNRTKQELDNYGTLKDADIQDNDKIILYPLPIWNKEKHNFVPPRTEPKPQPLETPTVTISDKQETQQNTTIRIENNTGQVSPKVKKGVNINLILSIIGLTVIGSFFISIYPKLLVKFEYVNNSLINSPEKFIQDNYSAINNDEFKVAWSNLSPIFQNKSVGGYGKYLDWWEKKVDRVNVNQIRLVSKDDKSAVVEVKLQYFMKKTQKLSDPESLRLWLIWDHKNSKWMIDKSQRLMWW